MNAMFNNIVTATMTSQEIANLLESRHDSVKRTIKHLPNLLAIAHPPLAEVSNPSPGPRTMTDHTAPGTRRSCIIMHAPAPGSSFLYWARQCPRRLSELYAPPTQGQRAALSSILRNSKAHTEARTSVIMDRWQSALEGRIQVSSDRRVEDARKYAEGGHSFTYTAKKLGLQNSKLRKLLDANGGADIHFTYGHQSTASKRGRAAAQAARRGRPLPAKEGTLEALKRSRVILRERALRTAFGVTGTLTELMRELDCKVSYTTVLTRLRAGLSVEEALTRKARSVSSARTGVGARTKPITPEEEGLAKTYAKLGHSLNFASQLMGMTRRKLGLLIEGTDIQFPNASECLGRKLAQTNQRGQIRQFSEDGKARQMQGFRRGLERQHKQHTAFGVTGFVGELVRMFNPPISARSVRVRLRKGMNIEDALTLPPQRPRAGEIPEQFKVWVEIFRRRTSARVAHAIARRLTPTMLCYRWPEFDIVTARDLAPWVTVEVRTTSGAMLHRLRFIQSFDESGVLFAFRQDKHGHIGFIAFEPDSAALQEGRP